MLDLARSGSPMKVLAVIPARLGATRLPRKPLRLLGGAPLITRVWERVSALQIADAVVVATDAEEIVTAVREAGGECLTTRADHPSGTDRIAEVAGRAEYLPYEVILNVQGDEPFVPPDALTGALAMVRDRGFPLGTAAAVAGRSICENPDIVKVVCADDGQAMYFSRAPIPWRRDARDDARYRSLIRQHIGVYAYRREALMRWVELPPHPLEELERLEQLRPLAAGMAIGVAVVDELPLGGVDTEEDLARANARWAHLYAGRT
ncbi:MAG: 3-deoxy-manno-octulosonate cytidylyltransferase [Gemmatimonadaceae bacterium]